MSEQEKFEAWWGEKGFNSVILRAAAWTAWMARAELDRPATPSSTEDHDEWVVQDQVPVRIGVDEYRYASWYKDDWRRVAASGNWSGKEYHNWTDRHGDTLHVRCRRRDLPKIEQPEQPHPQPAKTRVRLWVRSDAGSFGSGVVASTCEKTGDWQEIHYDSEGFYVEEVR